MEPNRETKWFHFPNVGFVFSEIKLNEYGLNILQLHDFLFFFFFQFLKIVIKKSLFLNGIDILV